MMCIIGKYFYLIMLYSEYKYLVLLCNLLIYCYNYKYIISYIFCGVVVVII